MLWPTAGGIRGSSTGTASVISLTSPDDSKLNAPVASPNILAGPSDKTAPAVARAAVSRQAGAAKAPARDKGQQIWERAAFSWLGEIVGCREPGQASRA